MSWNVVYDSLNGATWVPYDWKFDHEYIVFSIAGHRNIEMDHSRCITLAAAINPGDRGFAIRTIDGWMIFDQVTKGIRSIDRRGGNVNIIRILERPINFGTASPAGDNDNWEHFWSGAVTDFPIQWEDDYEYLVHAHGVFNVGPYGGNPRFVAQGYAFCPASCNRIDNGLINSSGEIYHAQVFGGWCSFFRAPGNPSSLAGRRMKIIDTNANLRYLARRPIRTVTQPDDKYNGWKRIFTQLPKGKMIGGKSNEATAFPWENDKEYSSVYSDPRGTDEISCASIYTDPLIVTDPSVLARWRWNILATESGSSAPFGFCPETWERRGYRQVHSWGEHSPHLYEVYERTPVVPVAPPPPDPTPPPPVPCEDRCYFVDDVWSQEALVEVRFVNPPDWQQRKYEYLWHGDIGNGMVELLEVQEEGRIAKIRFTKQLALEDNRAQYPITITATVADKQYAVLGVSDTDSGTITFELPCVLEGNDPEIRIEDMSIVELDVSREIDVRVFLSEPYQGSTPLCVDWRTQDGTAKSDLSVRSLAKDDQQLPHVMVIENIAGDRKMYLDGAFPKFYNGYWNDRATVQKYGNTLLFLQNVMNWLSGSKTGGAVLLMGDAGVAGQAYDVKDSVTYTGFTNYFTSAAAGTGRTLTVMYGNECPETQAFFDGFDCVLYISSAYTGGQVNSPALIAAMKASHLAGQGFGVIADHGVDGDPSGIGFYKGANEVLFDFYGIKFKGSIDRDTMNLTVENAIAQNGPHPLWTGMTGQINSGQSEAYIDAVDQEPDYVGASGQICFQSGESEKTIPITIVGDSDIENDETFEIILSNNTRGILVKPIGTITIRDDDATPCGVETPAGGAGTTETIHYLGPDAGRLDVNYTMYSVPDMMEIFYEGQLVATTGGLVSGNGTLSFFYPGPPRATTCMIRVTGPDGTAWTYTMNCPTPIPQISGYIYGTSVEAQARMNAYSPPTQQEIFNS